MPPCAVCAAARAAYTCPSCAAHYCSAPCFQGHGAPCTERFFRAQLLAECAAQAAAPAGGALRRQQRLGALGSLLHSGAPSDAPGEGAEQQQQQQQQAEVEEEGGLPECEAAALQALAAAVDAAPSAEAREQAEAALEAALSPAARLAFHRAVALGEALPGGGSQTPWWAAHSPTPRPFEDSEGGDGAPAGLRRLQRPQLPPLRALLPRGQPSPALPCSALEVLYAYAHAYLLHDGDLTPSSGAPRTLLAVAACLAADARYASPREAAAAALRASAAPAVRLAPTPSPALALRVLQDACALGLLASPAAALQGLLHAWSCVAEAARGAEAQGSGSGSARQRPGPLALAERKLWFLCAWAQEHLTADACAALQAEALGVCEEGMAGLVGAGVAGGGGAGGAGGGAGAGAAPLAAAPASALEDALAGRLLQRRTTLRALPACLLLARSGGGGQRQDKGLGLA